MFRKPQHRVEMPEVVKATFRPTAADKTAAGRRFYRAPNLDWTARARLEDEARKLTQFENVTFEQVRAALQVKWERVSDLEVQATIELLLEDGFFKTHMKGIYKLPELPESERARLSSSLPSRYSGWKQRDHSGTCLKCGHRASNKNRHNNAEHREEECKLNQIKAIMET